MTPPTCACVAGEPESLLVQALDGDARALAVVRSADRELGSDLCAAFLTVPWRWSLADVRAVCPFGQLPAACFIDAASDAYGVLVEVRGVCIYLDNVRRVWASMLLRVDRTPTAVIRRFGREGDDVGEELVPAVRDREWRRFRRLRGVRLRDVNNGNPRAVDDFAAWLRRLNTVRPYIPRGCTVDAHLERLAWSRWQDWSPEQAIAAHTLGLTRYGAGLWI